MDRTGTSRLICAVLCIVAAILAWCSPARADLRLCNRTSYVLDLALGLEDKGAAATRGWFRIDPGQCRGVLSGRIEADQVYVFARALPAYGGSPLPQAGHVDLCIADGNFVIAGAKCEEQKGQRVARFTAVKPAETESGLTTTIAEEAGYDDEQARLAGIQRLLAIAGYDAGPVDGIGVARADAALARFLGDRKLPAGAAAATVFASLAEAVKPGGGLSWCNETQSTVMAALGIEDGGTVVTRGWYRVEPGNCLRPEIFGQPRRLFSFAEAVDRNGTVIMRGDRPLVWGGDRMLCTRGVRFELDDHADCVAKGLNANGFAPVETVGGGATVHFRE